MAGLHWYAAAGASRYPIDDAATGRDDAGAELPHGILVDAGIVVPATVGICAFVSGITVSDTLVTILISASTVLAANPAHVNSAELAITPIGTFAIAKNKLVLSKQYALTSLVNGVSGWVVFGEGIDTEYSGRFSSAAQSQLLLRCARPQEQPPVLSLGVLYTNRSLFNVGAGGQLNTSTPGTPIAEALVGSVRIAATSDVNIRLEYGPAPRIAGLAQFDLDEDDRPVVPIIYLSLKDRYDRNVFQLYAGNCVARPESGNCPRPPLETINDIGPDCDGNIDIVFAGIDVLDLTRQGYIIIGHDTGLEEACGAATVQLPDSTGELPNQPEDGCSPVESGGELFFAMPPSWLFAAPADAGPDYYVEDLPDLGDRLPYSVDFGGLPTDWRLLSGNFAEIDAGYSALAATAAAHRNLLLWNVEVHDLPITGRISTTLLLEGINQRNAGLLLCHRLGTDGRSRFWTVRLDKQSDSIEVRFFNGSKLLPQIAKIQPAGLIGGFWYKLVVTYIRHSDRLILSIRVDGPDGPRTLSGVSIPDTAGQFGVGTFGGASMFSDFAFEVP